MGRIFVQELGLSSFSHTFRKNRKILNVHSKIGKKLQIKFFHGFFFTFQFGHVLTYCWPNFDTWDGNC